MKERTKNIITLLLIGGMIFGLALWCVLKPADDTSEAERRPLAQMPEISIDTLLSGKFTSDFEEYAADQFPLREGFRSIKAYAAYYLLRQGDNNGVYIEDGFASKIEYPLNEDSLDRAAAVFKKVYDKYLAESSVYFSIIPDKNAFMAKQNGYPALDYDRLTDIMRENTPFMEYIPIDHLLELEDYYRTDTHWRQEKILDVASCIGEAMGADISGEYTQAVVDKPFYGVYCGQAALPLPAETMYYLMSDTLADCRVYDHETGKYMGVYDMEKAAGHDSYEIFLSGSKSLLTIENPNCNTGKELIVFRDSFGGSIIPLMLEGYSTVTVADIRYISSDVLGRFVDFHGQDALFLYSTLVLNNSVTLK